METEGSSSHPWWLVRDTPLGRNRLLGTANLVATIATFTRVPLEEGTKPPWPLVTAEYSKTQCGAYVALVPLTTEPQIRRSPTSSIPAPHLQRLAGARCPPQLHAFQRLSGPTVTTTLLPV